MPAVHGTIRSFGISFGNMENRDYLIEEKPLKALLILALPMIAGNIFQQFYTMADSMIVGRLVGENALASIGASYALTTVFISIAIGGGVGSSVITSRAFGAKDYQKVKDSAKTAIISFLVIGGLLASFGLAFSEDILVLLNTPKEIMEEADVYLGIYFLGLPFLFLYNVISALFNSIGRSSIPLVLLIFSSVLNVVLDLAAVAGLGMGVAGAAWATLFAQALSAVISSAVLVKMIQKTCGKGRGRFSFPSLGRMLAISVPSIVQQSSISIGMMLVQSVVNGFGSNVLAGYSAAMRVDAFVTVPFFSLGNAMSSFTAQNIGADKRDRVGRGYAASCLVIMGFGVLIAFALVFFHDAIMNLFIPADGSDEARMAGGGYMSFLGCFYWILGLAVVTGGVLRGLGHMTFFTIGSIGNLAFRLLGSIALAPVFGVQVIWYVVPVGWIIYLVMCLAGYRRCALERESHAQP